MNNVGVGLDKLRSFDRLTEKELQCHILVNMSAATHMSKLVLPSMIEKGRGAIINMASMAGIHPVPYYVTYGASKVSLALFLP